MRLIICLLNCCLSFSGIFVNAKPSLNSVKDKQVKQLTMFQQQVEKCNLGVEKIHLIHNFAKLKESIENQFFLVNESISQKEVLFSKEQKDFKLKVRDDEISLYQVSLDGTSQLIDAKVSSEVKTPEGRIKQILLNAQIDEDWGEYKSQRSGGLILNYRLNNNQITHLKVSTSKHKFILECQLRKKNEVCYCISN